MKNVMLVLLGVILLAGCGDRGEDEENLDSRGELQSQLCPSLQSALNRVLQACGPTVEQATVAQYISASCSTALGRINPSRCAGLFESSTQALNACGNLFQTYGNFLPSNCRTAVNQVITILNQANGT